MKTLLPPHFERLRVLKQRGVVLFLALVALLVMSLAAVALIRSVDTSTLIAGNLAFRQATTNSADAGIEAGIISLDTTQAANPTLSVFQDLTHPLNNTALGANQGYHSKLDDAALPIFSNTTWDPATNNSVDLGTDAAGNRVQYLIQRACRTANATVPMADCMFGLDPSNENQTNVPLPSEVCEKESQGCPPAGQSPFYRITSRTTGRKNSVSYVQAFVN